MNNYLLLIFLFLIPLFAESQTETGYWNKQKQLVPWRFPVSGSVKYEDLDSDGDPDLIYSFINDSVPVIWIDDDDDMKSSDFEGDTDNDCLLIDRNKDGIFAGPNDFSVDWADENSDGIADIQMVAQNGGTKNRNYFDWDADFMIFIDKEKDGIQHFIDWNEIRMKAWEHNGHSNFFEDYHGNTLFLKMHASTFRISDLRFSWENPFLFYDTDDDGLSEWTIRLVDTPHFRPKTDESAEFSKVNPEFDVIYSEKIDWVGISWDLDNDNGQGNEFDFDMSLRFTGPGFGYADQVHKFKTLRGLQEANRLMYDSRWRKMDELIYPDHQSAWPLVFEKGEWTECRLVFDEDDDCNRWERVEFYDPRNLFKSGQNGGGLDHNGQADTAGDRGEFDLDSSGEGKLYIGSFDGRIHLYGAEWGAWRIDQTAISFQGFGGLYDRWKGGRIQRNPEKFATVKYTDTDLNGFIDQLEYDLDGDTIFEEKVSLKELEIPDAASVINTSKMNYHDFQELFRSVAEKQFARAQHVITIAKNLDINPVWYAFWMNPRTLYEKYEYGYWLNFYLYNDIRQWASVNRKDLVRQIDKAYYSGDWGQIKL
jgi:hypothetical protein